VDVEVPVEGGVVVGDFGVLVLPGLGLPRICHIPQLELVLQEGVAVQVVLGHGCELDRSELDEDCLLGLLYVGDIAEITKQVVDVAIIQLSREGKAEIAALVLQG
jgi:hypothetical protein